VGGAGVPLGERILQKRKQIGCSQETLAERLGVTASFVSQIEKGTRNPSYGLLQKISFELDVPVEYLVGGETKGVEDPTSNLITSVLRFLDTNTKNRILEYIHHVTGTKRYHNFPLFDSPTQYAQYILKRYKYNTPPIDPYKVAALLGVRVLTTTEELDHEGILYKCGEEPIILLSGDARYEPRRKFTIAMLLGHLVIPWHLRSMFYRKKGRHSLDEEDQLGIEAREFAGSLMIPPHMVREDFKSITPGLKSFEELAYHKYGSSMLAIAQKYLQSHSRTSVLITSEAKQFTRIYEAGFPHTLAGAVRKGSLAYSFLENPPGEKEFRSGVVEATAWLDLPPQGISLYEESLLDPSFGTTITFLQVRKIR
jgi:transcriptional regulator with XRE-family HTH domain